MRGCDFHCHVDLHSRPRDVVRECEDQHIAVLAVTTTPRAWPQNQEWTEGSSYVHSAVGLHPELVGERYDEVGLLEECMGQTRLIGEVGLDGSPHNRGSWVRQLDVFSRVLKRANDVGGCVLSVHSRRAANRVVDMIRHYTDVNRVLPILHWYSGTERTAKKALESGCYFSINLRMMAHDAGCRLVVSLPRERLLIETDAPFTAVDNHRYDPGWPIEAAGRVAQLKGIPTDEFSEQLQENARCAFAFASIAL